MIGRRLLSTVFHRYLRVPYALNTYEFQSPKKPKATFVLLHGIGNSLHAWNEVVALMPNDVRIIGVDLLGFGDSPKPAWATYDAKTQARSLGVTLLGLRTAQRPIIVGHSLGALVAVEVARRYSLLPRQLVLCSPPFYSAKAEKNGSRAQEDMLRTLYGIAKKHPSQLQQLSPLAVKLGIANKALNITSDNVDSYMGALEASIINQTSLRDVARLQVPIDIFYGIFDPVVVKRNITTLAKTHDNILLHRMPVAHEITGLYVNVLAGYLTELSKHTTREL